MKSHMQCGIIDLPAWRKLLSSLQDLFELWPAIRCVQLTTGDHKDIISISQGCSFIGDDWVRFLKATTTWYKHQWRYNMKNTNIFGISCSARKPFLMHCLHSWQLTVDQRDVTYFSFPMANFVVFVFRLSLWYPKHSLTLSYHYHTLNLHKHSWNTTKYRYILYQVITRQTLFHLLEKRNTTFMRSHVIYKAKHHTFSVLL